MENSFAKILIDVILIWAAIVTALVTIVAGMMAFNFFTQMRRSQEVLSQMTSKFQEQEQRYKLAQLKTPEEILREVQAEYEPLILNLRKAVQSYAEQVDTGMKQLSDELKTVKASKSPSQDDFCRGILAAFREVKAISAQELKSISEILIQNCVTPGTH